MKQPRAYQTHQELKALATLGHLDFGVFILSLYWGSTTFNIKTTGL